MTEIYTRALVLGRENVGEADGKISFFTEDQGKIVAKARGIRKITSKLSAHLQPLRFVKVRFVRSDGDRVHFGVIDSVLDDAFKDAKTHARDDMRSLVECIDMMMYEFHPDPRIWKLLEEIFLKNYKAVDGAHAFLVLMGFSPTDEKCRRCSKSAEALFYPQDMFVCREHAFKLPQTQVIYFT